MLFVYRLLLYCVTPVACAVLLWRSLREPSYRCGFSERFGFGGAVSMPSIWIHAASVGEVQAAAVLVRALRERHPAEPLVITTVTPAGAERARALLAEGVLVRFAPFDLPGSVARFFDRARPRLAIVLETEIWPNLYREGRRRGVPLVIASARLSERSVRRYRRFTSLLRATLSSGVVVAAQSPTDAERFRALGADPANTFVMGNLKLDFTAPPEALARGREIRERYAPDRPLWVAGSTHEGEEQQVLEAHRAVRARHPQALLALVPRHRARFMAVAEWLERSKVRFVTRSRGEAPPPDAEVLLVDTLGELLEFYAAADLAFVGGSLVPIGGHNLLEPASLGIPALTGPCNSNGAEIAERLISRGAVDLVSDGRQLGARVAALLADAEHRARMGAAGRATLEESRGALGRLLERIGPLLEVEPGARRPARETY